MLRSAGACQDGMSQRRIVRVADLHELGHHEAAIASFISAIAASKPL